MFKKPQFNNNKTTTKPEYEQKLIDLRRVARVVAGGRRFSFRATMVIGDKNGKVGVGTGKGTDTSLAIEKAIRLAKKNTIKFHLTKNKSIKMPVEAKFASARVYMKPLSEGMGLRAGGSVRIVLFLAGAQNVSAKILSPSKNKINNAKAAIKALEKLQS